ncbi:MAG: hypothetical protein ACREBU_10890 [Nitrososphaera sp.]
MPRRSISLPVEESEIREYDRVILELFRRLYKEGATQLPFSKRDIEHVAADLQLAIRNLPDITYTYRSGRSPLPLEILKYGHWAIDGAGKSKYVFIKMSRAPYFDLPDDMDRTPIPDATPQIVLEYQSNDEQALLARVRYNRLVDTFTGLTTYQLQGHFRTTIPRIGQVEIDDLYLGVNEDGEWSAIPVEAKVGNELLGVVQVRALTLFAKNRFSGLRVRPLGIKALLDGTLLFVEFNDQIEFEAVAPRRYKRYQLTHRA